MFSPTRRTLAGSAPAREPPSQPDASADPLPRWTTSKLGRARANTSLVVVPTVRLRGWGATLHVFREARQLKICTGACGSPPDRSYVQVRHQGERQMLLKTTTLAGRPRCAT